jgi:probable HAF family extracellular repeat protein
MRRTILAGFTAALLIFLLPSAGRVGAEAPLYTVQDLGTIEGAVPQVTGINASGEASGFAVVNGVQRAVRFRDGAWSYVPGLPTDVNTVALAINDHGDVVGSRIAAGQPRAYRYTDATGVVEFIAPLPGGTVTTGMAINNNGEIVGQANVPGGTRAYRAAPGFPAVALPTLGGTLGTACGINDNGQVVGTSQLANTKQHAYRADPDGTITDLGTFDGASGSSNACGIDADGHVSGQAQGGGAPRAFLFAGGLMNLDAFGGTSSTAQATANGTTVGFFNLNGPRAFAHTEKEGSFDLNTRIPADSGWLLQQAKAVNAAGAIVGMGLLGGQLRAFMLTPPAKDTTPPTINSVTVTPSSIVPPNKAMVSVSVAVNATDDRDVAPACSVAGIDGHGAPAENYLVTGALSGTVRAVGGSTYSFLVTCVDAAGNAAQASGDVVVPPDTTGPVFTDLSATPATIWPPLNQMVSVTISAAAIDDSGDVPACRLGSIASSGSAADGDFAVTGVNTGSVRAVGGRTYTFTAVCTDSSGNSSSAATAVYVPPDTTAPVINSVSASPYYIWPANGKMVNVSVSVNATDNVDPVPACSISSIAASDFAPGDAVITGRFSAQVRATRDSDHSVRVYTLHVTCVDTAGNQTQSSVDVRVAKESDASSGMSKRDRYTVAKR